ncbi:adenosine deaminase [Lysobacter sp. Root559]|uniref:adenosine deaminase family protein n=1 Tax=Lysobacter sp. Root559 TaxID=1736559 RepID=UPI0006F9FA0C|nr:adenosine deaminase [Lysobacter sp. Root559]KQZ63564.1 adenosine deaminase [Lysobacter sp. Root559]
MKERTGCRETALLAVLWLACMPVAARPASDEARTAAYFDRIAASPPQLRIFLQAMPKGADLHNHASGSVYAEDFLRWAAEQDYCIASDSHRIVRPPCVAPASVPARDLASKDYGAYSRAIDALSMRNASLPDFERFFASFDGFRALSSGDGSRLVAAARELAADDRVSYLELMTMPRSAQGLLDAAKASGQDGNDFGALAAVLAPLLPAAIAEARAELDRYEATLAAAQGCTGAAAQPACTVEVRYQIPVPRHRPPAQAFAAMAFGFALVEADPRWVGVNIVGPEHHPLAQRDYALHMRMFAYLKQRHPTVPLSLHAGEQTLGLVAPRELRFHVRDAVTVAGAKRIGHGVDIAYESDAQALLQRMARERIAVEINLSSNAAILGVKGADHPLRLYREAGVPVVLASDDQGVLRSDMSNEYLRAAQEHGLRYADLKRIARDSIEYAFLPGDSLWQGKVGGARVAVCAAALSSPDPACERYLQGSEKARMQWRLEQQFGRFEREPR